MFESLKAREKWCNYLCSCQTQNKQEYEKRASQEAKQGRTVAEFPPLRRSYGPKLTHSWREVGVLGHPGALPSPC
jgi:hypothetical protein